MARTRQRIFTGTVCSSPMKNIGGVELKAQRSRCQVAFVQQKKEEEEEEATPSSSSSSSSSPPSDVLGEADFTPVFWGMLEELRLPTTSSAWSVQYTLHKSKTLPSGKSRYLLTHTEGAMSTSFPSFVAAIDAVAKSAAAGIRAPSSPSSSSSRDVLERVVRKHTALAKTRVPLVPSSSEAGALLRSLGVPTVAEAEEPRRTTDAPSSSSHRLADALLSSLGSAPASGALDDATWASLNVNNHYVLNDDDDVSDADVDSVLLYIGTES